MGKLGLPAGIRYDDMRRTARVLEIVQDIARAPRRWRRKTLAERYEVCERMIQKDLYIIRERLRLPLRNDGEGYYFERVPQLPTVSYSFSEALALLLAIRAAQSIPGIGSSDLAAAVAKLESLFPEEFGPFLPKLLNGLLSFPASTHRQGVLAQLYRALLGGKRAKIVYISGESGKPRKRKVEPYAIFPYVRSWQMVAYCHLRGEVRTFKIDRIREVEILDEPYVVPPDFDLDGYLGDSWGLMRGAAGEPEEVELLFDPVVGRWVSEEHWHKSQEMVFLADGSVLVKFHIGITPEFVHWVLYYGSQVRVLKPKWLKEKVAEEHRRAAEMGDITQKEKCRKGRS
ncbi:MAG TPA: WYL domain-containing protein [Candidatus Latescibacteria bacterium]|nr:WYL domain-containing protein [Candidatus Latescibacterota bacterium]